ncbi:hypothetical protein [Paenibacillus shenyangensis]|uniref:hypothetical protein n=1 Tax=Paenibacillus sp. A9 TaxID=1284352 RepID=UPI0003798AFB|nr:hypothetical protein [Paenibacillus sp. A9]
MDDTYYLPNTEPSFINYPVLRDEQANIEAIVTYAERAYSALYDYNEAIYDRVDINTDELEQYIDLCRRTCNALGTSDRVPHDVLIELRSILAELYKLRQLAADTEIIGEPDEIEEDEGI